MRRSSKSGFTLLETLIVVGVIVILTGVTAVALSGRGSQGAALASAQSIVAGLVSTTRSQAALYQVKARLLVYAQRPTGTGTIDSNKYLRALQVVRETDYESNVWVAVGDPVMLPAPICIVPRTVTREHLSAGVNWNPDTVNGPISSLQTTAVNMSYRGQAGSTQQSQLQYFGSTGQARPVYYIEFGPDGTVLTPSTGAIKIAVSPAIVSGNAVPTFTSNATVRGVTIRRTTGAMSMVNDATGF